MNEPRSPRSAASVQGNAAVQGSADKPPRRKPPTSMVVATWAVRACFAFVFAVNVQCALGFTLMPEAYMGAYELAGVPGRVAAQGIGVAFLMWNCTYPLVIWRPARHRALAGVVLAQQVVGLAGETAILAGLPADHAALAGGIMRFVAFDGFGLAVMAGAFAWLLLAERRCRER